MAMPTRLLLSGALLAAILVAVCIHQFRRPISRLLSISGQSASDYAADRLLQINAALASAKPGFIFLTGDSHAELLGNESICGQPVVNGGSHGAGISRYRDLLAGLDFRQRPSATVLILGTNDIFLKNKLSRPENFAARVEPLGTIMKTLNRVSSRLVMTPLPPIPEETARILDLVALKTLSDELQQRCEKKSSCDFVDPFEETRTDTFGLSRPGAIADGLHLSDYGKVREAIERHICPVPIVVSDQAPP